MMASGGVGISLAFTITAAKTNTSSISSKLLQNTDELSICLALTGYPSIVVVQSSTNTITPSSAPTSSPGIYSTLSSPLLLHLHLHLHFDTCLYLYLFTMFLFLFLSLWYFISLAPSLCLLHLPHSTVPPVSSTYLPSSIIHISCIIYIFFPTLSYNSSKLDNLIKRIHDF